MPPAQPPDPAEAAPREPPAAGLLHGKPADDPATELLRLAALPRFRRGQASPDDAQPAEGAADPSALVALFQLVQRAAGLDLTQYKAPTVLRRIERRMSICHLTSMKEYVERLAHDPTELSHLREDVLIHMTAFFREPKSFEALKTVVFPQLLAGEGSGPIRVWVPGCSSGEEVYSVTIALAESLGELPLRTEMIQVFGTDVSEP